MDVAMLRIGLYSVLIFSLLQCRETSGEGIRPTFNKSKSLSNHLSPLSQKQRTLHLQQRQVCIKDSLILKINGGGKPVYDKNNVAATSATVTGTDTSMRIKSLIKIGLSSSIGLLLIHQCYHNRNKLPSKEDVQAYAFKSATKVKDQGNIGILYYIVGLACFEMLGISTCPFEISGGFVYGIRKGVMINIMGKLIGAFTVYSIGRNFLKSKIRSKLFLSSSSTNGSNKKETKNMNESKTNQIINLVEKSVIDEPFTTALVLRYSVFPQLIKNLLSSILEPIDWKLFLVVTFMQVSPFSFLFTCLGYDSAQRLLDPQMKANYILSGFFLLSTLYGIFGGTTVVALWYRSKTKG